MKTHNLFRERTWLLWANQSPLLMILGLCALLTSQAGAAVVTWDGGGGDGSWHTAANWSTDQVPGSSDDVVINAPTNVTVMFSSGYTTVRSLQCGSSLQINGGRLIVANGQSSINGPFSLQDYGTLIVLGVGAELAVNGVASVGGGTLECQHGGVMRLPGLRQLDTRSRTITLSATFSGSSVDASGVTNVLHSSSFSLDLTAATGGRIDLSGIAKMEGTMNVTARGTGSSIDLTGIRGIWSNTNANRLSSLEVLDGGEVRAPGLSGLARVDLTIRRSDSRALTAALASFRDATLDLQGATNDFSLLVELINSDVIARSDALLRLTNVGQLMVTNGSPVFQAEGPNSLLDLSGTTNVVLGANGNPSLVGKTGGQIDLSNARISNGRLDVSANGAGSWIDLSGIVGDWGNTLNAFHPNWQAISGGQIRAPSLTGLTKIDLTINGPQSRLIANGLRSYENGTMEVRQATNNLSSLTQLGACVLRALNGGAILASNLTVLSPNGGSLELYASDADSRIVLPGVTNVILATTATMAMNAVNGGVIDLSRARIPDGDVSATANGVGSVIDLSGIQGLWSNQTGGHPSALEVVNGGEIRLPNLTGLRRIGLTIRDGSSRFPTAGLRSLVQGSLYLERATNDFTALADILNSDLTASENSLVRLTNITTLWITNSSPTFRATGPACLLDLSGVTRIVMAGIHTLGLNAQQGGQIDLSRVSAPNGRVTASADGIGSQIDFSGIQGAWSNTVSGWSANLKVEAGGAILIPGVTALDNIDLQFLTTGVMSMNWVKAITHGSVVLDDATVSFPSLADKSETTFTYRNGGQAIFPPAADLVVTGIQAPETAVAGQLLSVVWLVKNQGTNSASGMRSDAVYLSKDRNVGNDLFLGHFAGTNALGPGETRGYTNTVIVPSELTGGYYFMVSADSLFDCYEDAAETNNCLAATNITAFSSPDLQVSLLTAPATARFGEAIPVTWAVKNAGTMPANRAWSDRLSFTTNSASLTGARTLLTRAAASTLAAGASYTNTQTVALPLDPGQMPGTGYLVLTTDSTRSQPEANEGNNSQTLSIALNLPSLPDLAVTAVLAPGQTEAGQAATLVWGVTNQGSADAAGLWSETVSVSNNVSGLVDLARIDFTNGLVAGAFLWRTQMVVIPLSGLAGQFRFGVQADSLRDVMESNESNNFVQAVASTTIPLRLNLELPVSQIAENAVTPVMRASITRNGDLAQPLTVTFSSSDTNEIVAPPAMVLGGNQPTVIAEFRVVRDGRMDGPKVVTLRAMAAGYPTAETMVTVLDSDLPTLTLTLSTNMVGEGHTVATTVTREGAVEAPLQVTLSSDNPGQLSPPMSVTIPSRSNSWVFAMLAVDDNLIEPPTTYTVTASAAGFESSQARVTILDNDIPQVTLTLADSVVVESAGNQATTATLTRNPVSTRSLTVEVISSDPTAAQVPARVVIPANQASASFPVAAADDLVLDGPQTTVLTPYPLASGENARLGQGTPATLTVLDDDGPTLRVAVKNKLVAEGLNPATTAVVSRNTSPTNALVVTLGSSDVREAVVPPTVTLPAGTNAVVVNLVTIADAIPDGNKTVILTASSAGYTSGSDSVVVTDADLPDLVVSEIVASTNAWAGLPSSISYRIINQGLSITTTSFVTRVLLSRDPFVGDDILVNQFRFTGTLSVGQEFSQNLQIAMPTAVGQYWVVVQTDSDNTVLEGLENNNARISQMPIQVKPDYTATAWTDVDIAPPGTPVAILGEVQYASDAHDHVPVNVHIVSRGTERIIRTTTQLGNFFHVIFEPLPTEAGFYEIFATHPGVTNAAKQDEFRLLGFAVTPINSSFKMIEGSTVSRSLTLRNMSDVPLSGLAVAVTRAPEGMKAVLSLSSNALPGTGTIRLDCQFTAQTSTATGSVEAMITTAEGLTNTVKFAVGVEPLRPRLIATPASLASGMARGHQTPVEFQVINEGGLSTGPLTVVLPGVSWLHLASANPLPPLAPGATNRITLLLTPDANLELGPYNGALALNSSNTSLTVPFKFRAVSEAKGDLLVTAVDEFTYYAAGAPRLAGARVVVRDAFAYTNAVSGLTDTNGHFFAGQLAEGPYEVEVTADNHIGYRNTLMVSSGQTNELTAFLSRTTVKYTWTVEPVQIEDRYRITVETTFETAVPIPVVTIEPKTIDMSEYAGQPGQIDFKISNHGLIAAQYVELKVPAKSLIQFPTLSVRETKNGYRIMELGNLAAQSSLTLPARILSLPAAGASGAKSATNVRALAIESGPCSYDVPVTWKLACGSLSMEYETTTTVYNNNPGCRSSPPFPSYEEGSYGVPPPYTSSPDLDGGGGWVAPSPPPWQANFTCNPDCLVKAGIGCVPGPIGDAMGTEECLRGLISTNEYNPLNKLDCAVGGLGMLPGGAVPACAYDLMRCFIEFSPADGASANAASLSGSTKTRMTTLSSKTSQGQAVASSDTLAPYRSALRAYVEMIEEMTGFPYAKWLLPDDVPGNPDSLLRQFSRMLTPDSDEGRTISESEWAGFLQNPSKYVEPMVVETFHYRWRYTLEAWSKGVMGPTETNLNIIDYAKLLEKILAMKAGQDWADLNGYANPLAAVIETVRTLAAKGENGGICAQVKFRTEQEAVLSRDAFRASLELVNQDLVRLENVEVVLQVFDASGQDATDLFGIRSPELLGLSGVDGTGILPAGVTGSARWILIPTTEAAPTLAAQYFVTGHFKYSLAGTEVSVPLALAPITVLPSPRLVVRYFHERDVFSDDPFTPEIEPRIPFNLGILIQNQGFGAARNFRITSGQPQIVENTKGLLIDYQILATEVAGQSLTPSLTAQFGDINPGHTVIGRWLFGSSIHGMFTDYRASFEHLDALGEKKISLIDQLTIHEMIHLVQAPGRFEDGQPDFLVNDVPDLYDRADTLYLSDGSSNAVAAVEQAFPSGAPTRTNLTVILTASMPPGWAYLRVPDPAAGKYRLVQATRSDGTEIAMGTNVWITDRTFLGLGRRPTYESILHLLDYDSTGSYSLTYSDVTDDAIPPTSRVAALPANSGEQIPVSWSGEDNEGGRGVVAYDLYVSENGGPFLLWLMQTPANGAIYRGTQGNSYAFYSIATDGAGNVESMPGMPDAQTVVSLVNHAPQLGALPDQSMDEGIEFSFYIPATDPDQPADRLSFNLLSGPQGLFLNPDTGSMRWQTSEVTGPSTNPVTFIVTDNGAPPLSITGALQIVVREINTAPFLPALTNVVINEGFRLLMTHVAYDLDLPTNSLRYVLMPGQPEGSSMDAISGVFRWQPTETQGPSTNLIGVVVTDNGIPPLSATQQFTVVVRDSLSELALSLGSTNVLAGESNSVPLVLKSGLKLDSVRFELEADMAHLTNLSAQAASSEVAYLLQEQLGLNRQAIELGFNESLLQSGTRIVARLGFLAVSNQSSAVVPLQLEQPAGFLSNGARVGNAVAQGGRVIVVARNPVLESMRLSPSVWRLLLYGRTGTNYVFETATDLETLVWTSGASWTLTNRVQAFDMPVLENQPGQFYRARERR